MGTSKLISVVVPCFNEEEVLTEMHARLVVTMEAQPHDYEIIYVDDGSNDGTWDLLRGFNAADARVNVVRFSRNFGHQLALTAGIDSASGDALVLIDADLQDPPEVIADMLLRWEEGYEVIYGRRMAREGETILKLVTAKAFYRAIRFLSNTDIPRDTGDFRMLDRKVVTAMQRMREHDRFLRGMVSWAGFRQVAVPYRRSARAAGRTKFSAAKMLAFACDAILSFSLVPLRLAILSGFLCAGLAVAGIVYAVAARLFTGNWVGGWASIFVGGLFFGGVQLICLGIIGEYIGRIYREVKARPLYLVSEYLGFEPRQGDATPRAG